MEKETGKHHICRRVKNIDPDPLLKSYSRKRESETLGTKRKGRKEEKARIEKKAEMMNWGSENIVAAGTYCILSCTAEGRQQANHLWPNVFFRYDML
jgi:hypothetical protein